MVFLSKITGEFSWSKKIDSHLAKIKRDSVERTISFSLAKTIGENKAVLFNCKNNSLNVWSMATDEWKSILCRIPTDELLNMEKNRIEKNMISKGVPYNILEKALAISEFINYIAAWDADVFKQIYECYQKKKTNMTIGADIHNYIIKD